MTLQEAFTMLQKRGYCQVRLTSWKCSKHKRIVFELFAHHPAPMVGTVTIKAWDSLANIEAELAPALKEFKGDYVNWPEDFYERVEKTKMESTVTSFF